jgi:hypothetical protein
MKMKSFAFVCLMMAGTLCRGELAPTVAALPDAQRTALQKAVCFAESKEVVQNVFADLAVGTAGMSQQEVLRTKLAGDNLSMFCMAGPLNRENAAAEFEYGVPTLDQITQASMHTVELGTVVGIDDVTAISWQDDAPGQAHGSFQYDTKCGDKGTCLFQARQEGETWSIIRLAIQKKGSDLIEDGCPIFNHTEPSE